MVECKCIRNLIGFAASKPPCVIFTVCLAACAVGLLSLGFYVHEHGLVLIDGNESKELETLIAGFQEQKFCVFGNETGMTSSSNSTNDTTLLPVPVRFSIQILPKRGFKTRDQHVTHLTTMIDASEAGITGVGLINVTLSLSEPWHTKCEEKENCNREFDSCAVMMLPKNVIPQDFLDKPDCNRTAVHTMVEMHSLVSGTSLRPRGWCPDGVEAHAVHTVTMNPAALQMTDEQTVNLRLQYSSYFLFVMVVTSVLYGMIKGKPFKNGKKVLHVLNCLIY